MSEKMSSSKEWLLAFAIAIPVASVVVFYILIFKSPIPELSEQAQSLSDSYVDQLGQEVSIARQQGFLAQRQAKFDFLSKVIERGDELLEGLSKDKISVGGVNYLRTEIEADLQFRRERLKVAEAEVDSTQRAIGRMQDALSNLKDLAQYDSNDVAPKEAFRAQLVAFHSVAQLPRPTLSRMESIQGATKRARVDFDHRLNLLSQSSSPDLDDLFASMEESTISNFHWREELGLNVQDQTTPPHRVTTVETLDSGIRVETTQLGGGMIVQRLRFPGDRNWPDDLNIDFNPSSTFNDDTFVDVREMGVLRESSVEYSSLITDEDEMVKALSPNLVWTGKIIPEWQSTEYIPSVTDRIDWTGRPRSLRKNELAHFQFAFEKGVPGSEYDNEANVLRPETKGDYNRATGFSSYVGSNTEGKTMYIRTTNGQSYTIDLTVVPDGKEQ